MRQSNSNLRTVFLFMVVLGFSLNIFQMRKLRHDRRLNFKETDLGGAVKTKEPSSIDTVNAMQSADRDTIQLVKPDDFIFSNAWDASPIVVESHKLVFFTVPKAG